MPFDATPVTSPVIDLLQKVHKRLREHGWTQNTMYREKADSYCLLGALYKETENPLLRREAIDALGFKNDGSVIAWNDTNGRKKVGVIRSITLAIQKQREKLLLGAK